LIAGETTTTVAPAWSRASILLAAISPPPTTMTRRPASLTNIGKRLMSTLHALRDVCRRQISGDGANKLARQNRANLLVAVPGKEFVEGFFSRTLIVESFEQALNRVRHLRCGAAIANGTSDRGDLANASADAEVVSVDHFPVELGLLAF